MLNALGQYSGLLSEGVTPFNETISSIANELLVPVFTSLNLVPDGA
jgi:hypothetical protein